MNKLYFYFCLIALFAAGCAKEDGLEPSGIREDYFTVPEDATDPVSVLRRNFHERTGIHLLFNDTLRHEQQGTNPDGTPRWYTETIDFNYFITSLGSGNYSFEYLTDYDDMVAASEAVEEYILPYFQEKAYPYSLFLTQYCLSYNSNYEEYEDVGYIDGLRCLGLSTGDFVNMTDEEKATFGTDLIYNMVYNAIDNLSYDDPTLDPFTSYCEDYYYEYFDEVELPAGMDPENLTIEDMYTLGFLEEADYYWGDFPSQNSDLRDYLQEVFYTDEAEFRNTYAAYPVVIAKYEALKQIITDMGYNI